MIKLLAGVLALSIGATAPYQCGGASADQGGKPAPTDGDALYDLAQDFHAKGNEDAAKQTLKYLVDHYPSNRHVPAARSELGGEAASPRVVNSSEAAPK